MDFLKVSPSYTSLQSGDQWKSVDLVCIIHGHHQIIVEIAWQGDMQSSQDPHAPEVCRFDTLDFKLVVQFTDYNGKSPCINRKHDYTFAQHWFYRKWSSMLCWRYSPSDEKSYLFIWRIFSPHYFAPVFRRTLLWYFYRQNTMQQKSTKMQRWNVD
jgi:hypothetical protein